MATSTAQLACGGVGECRVGERRTLPKRAGGGATHAHSFATQPWNTAMRTSNWTVNGMWFSTPRRRPSVAASRRRSRGFAGPASAAAPSAAVSPFATRCSVSNGAARTNGAASIAESTIQWPSGVSWVVRSAPPRFRSERTCTRPHVAPTCPASGLTSAGGRRARCARKRMWTLGAARTRRGGAGAKRGVRERSHGCRAAGTGSVRGRYVLTGAYAADGHGWCCAAEDGVVECANSAGAKCPR
jgi:hypothetical protein